MVDRDSPVTPDELHAYIDGELPADRHGAVEAWLASHPEDAVQVEQWRTQADAIRSRYGAVVSEPVPKRLELNQIILKQRRPWRAVAAAAVVALMLGGAGGWVARGMALPVPAAPAGVDAFTAEALNAHRLYTVEVRHPVEVTGAERAHLVQWLSKRLDRPLRAPDLEPMGLTLIGGRLLPGPTGGPTAFFMYENPNGERFTIYCMPSQAQDAALHYKAAEKVAAFYWVDRRVAYVVSGPAERKRLWDIAKASYDQLDRTNTAPRSGG